ncbi:hypothetical protein B0G84_8844 [Paraburkholderia sp. BL8N3]|nr:hypothetical protein [Paraburkholderia sp. BL8N3]TCK31790.1 hypothetical protein B0G84_8844 [Paraburkholderia sp. BL8N3]
MTVAKEQKENVLIRIPLPVHDWLFSEAVELAKVQRGISVQRVIVASLESCEASQIEQDEAPVSNAGAKKKQVLVRLPSSLYERLYSESLALADVRRVRVTVPSLVVEKLSRLHRQAQGKQSVSP